MQPQDLRFGGGVAATVLNPVVVVVLVIVGVLMLVLPQRKVIIPFLVAVLFIPYSQILVVGGLHFPLLRILILFGMIRIFIIKGRGDWQAFSGGLNGVDKSVILFAVTLAVAGTLLFKTSQAFVFQLGNLFTILGTYVVLRCFIRDREDVVQAIRVLAWSVFVLGGVMVFEHLTGGWNPYALLGGARHFASDLSRDGRVRATASFQQPILAGTFGAVMLPLFAGIWLSEKKHHLTAAVGMIGGTTMAIACNSSTAFVAVLAGLGALCLWPLRGAMRLIRWGIVIGLVSLQMVMKSPVYHLMTRISFSGDSYHRYALINECVIHFSQWWLIGTNANASWGWDMWDTADQYVSNAISGGLLGLIFFVAIIVFGFKYVGRARRATTNRKQELFLWALGSMLFAYTVAYFGISLWDQSIVGWYALLAFIGAAAAPQVRMAKQNLAAVSDSKVAAAQHIQPAYAGRSGPRFLNRHFGHTEPSAPWHRQRAH